jgi:low affinity Fe/Cu permease
MGLMFMLTIAVIIAAVAALPIWPHSKNWGFYPISGVSVIILIILFFLLRGRL